MLQNPVAELVEFVEEGGKKLPQATVTYTTVMSKVGRHCTFSWDADKNKRGVLN